MKSIQQIGAAVIGGIALGLCAVTPSHAQAKPAGYMLVEIDVKDKDGYTKDYLPKVQALIKESGGKYIAGGFNKAFALSGAAPPSRVVIIQFTDIDAIKAFYAKEHQLEVDVGDKFASFRILGIEGLPQ